MFFKSILNFVKLILNSLNRSYVYYLCCVVSTMNNQKVAKLHMRERDPYKALIRKTGGVQPIL